MDTIKSLIGVYTYKTRTNLNMKNISLVSYLLITEGRVLTNLFNVV